VPNSKNIDKANILSNLILKEKPKTVVELGGYTGYSAIVFGAAMREAHGSDEGLHIFSLEMNPGHAEIARKLSASPFSSSLLQFPISPKTQTNPPHSRPRCFNSHNHSHYGSGRLLPTHAAYQNSRSHLPGPRRGPLRRGLQGVRGGGLVEGRHGGGGG